MRFQPALLILMITCALSSEEVTDAVEKAEDCGCNKLSRDGLVSKTAGSDGELGTCEKESKCAAAVKLETVENDEEEEAAVEIEDDGVVNEDLEPVKTEAEPVKAESDKPAAAPSTAPAFDENLVITDTEDMKVLRTVNPMMEIGGGEFLMGTWEAFIAPDGESPLRPARINSFFMDKREVSNHEFARFVGATNFITEVSSV